MLKRTAGHLVKLYTAENDKQLHTCVEAVTVTVQHNSVSHYPCLLFCQIFEYVSLTHKANYNSNLFVFQVTSWLYVGYTVYTETI